MLYSDVLSLMPYYKYDYSPLPSNSHKPRSRHWRVWLWPGCFAALLIIDLIFLIIYMKQRPLASALSPLDNFQDLNNLTAFSATAELSSSPRADQAIVSSLYTDAYTVPVVALGHSLRTHNVSARMILIYIPERISPRSLCLASAVGWTLHPVSIIPPPHGGEGIFGRYKDQYTKLTIWTLDTIGIDKVLYLDADTIVRRNFDEVFSLTFDFAAIPDVFEGERGFTIGFNAGVMFLRTNSAVFEHMLTKIEVAKHPPQFAEQAFLNLYFGAQAVRLPYAYNANVAIKRRKPELWNALKDEMRIVHYTIAKPFPLDGDGWVDPRDLEEYFRRNKASQDGFYAEELTWWEDSWRDLMLQDQGTLTQCTL